ERIIVDESIADEFVALISQRAAALPSTLLGPVVDMKTVQRCNALIDDALNKGARLLCGGMAESTQMRATLLDGVTREMRIWH
ncbi:salicylaldehyde dehydrogenase, partial [Klebsiella pneumoniae]|uniref:aldehyde dehydrogenase family protein n=1 Tax=Klebsiella pneumoniae TaxID=573 RepID=UPI000D9E1BA8